MGQQWGRGVMAEYRGYEVDLLSQLSIHVGFDSIAKWYP